MNKPLYVFDMDETLINADCAMIWNQFLVDKGIATEPNFLTEDKRLMGLYAEGKMNMDDYLQFSMSPLVDVPIVQVSQWVNECVEHHILPNQFEQSKHLIEQLKRDGIDMVIISATVSFLVAEVGRKIGIPVALGIDLVEQHGHYSAEISGIPSYREGKVAKLEEWLEKQTQHYTEIHFYTDSINDLPLCEYADFAYLVNPCPRLKAHSNQTNWQVLDWD